MADNWRNFRWGKYTRWRDVDTTNTFLARCYGLRKIDKENYPLRLVISAIIANTITQYSYTPTRFLERNTKQKFGTPIGSVIPPMLVQIDMKNLEKSVLERLGFVVPFYYRYDDDTLLCVPLDKLQTVIDTFNDYH